MFADVEEWEWLGVFSNFEIANWDWNRCQGWDEWSDGCDKAVTLGWLELRIKVRWLKVVGEVV